MLPSNRELASKLQEKLGPVEVGPFTPYFFGSTGVGTLRYRNQIGRYLAIHPLVFITIDLFVSTVSVAMSGNLQIGGLPFPVKKRQEPDYLNYSLVLGFCEEFRLASGTRHVFHVSGVGAAVAVYEILADNTSLAAPAATTVIGGTRLIVSGFYERE